MKFQNNERMNRKINIYQMKERNDNNNNNNVHDYQYILKERKTRRKNVAMAWLDNKKTYDIVPQNWIIDCLKMYKISDKVIKFIMESRKIWKVEMTAGGKTLAEVKIQRCIFQGNGHSLLLIVISMVRLILFRRCLGGYKFTKSVEKFNHLTYTVCKKMKKKWRLSYKR